MWRSFTHETQIISYRETKEEQSSLNNIRCGQFVNSQWTQRKRRSTELEQNKDDLHRVRWHNCKKKIRFRGKSTVHWFVQVAPKIRKHVVKEGRLAIHRILFTQSERFPTDYEVPKMRRFRCGQTTAPMKNAMEGTVQLTTKNHIRQKKKSAFYIAERSWNAQSGKTVLTRRFIKQHKNIDYGD